MTGRARSSTIGTAILAVFGIGMSAVACYGFAEDRAHLDALPTRARYADGPGVFVGRLVSDARFVPVSCPDRDVAELARIRVIAPFPQVGTPALFIRLPSLGEPASVVEPASHRPVLSTPARTARARRPWAPEDDEPTAG